MGTRTELEIRFIFDLTRPLTDTEKDVLPLLFGKMRALRSQGHNNRMGTADIDLAESALPLLEESKAIAELPVSTAPNHDSLADSVAAKIREALGRTRTTAEAAVLLGISERSLGRKMHKLGIKKTRLFTLSTTT